MYIETDRLFNSADITIMAAAVADYTPQEIFSEKIKKDKDQLNLKLVKTVDILHTLGQRKKQGQMLVGFALETSNELVNAKEKLQKKNLDFIVLNSLNDSGAGFQHDSNQITIIDKENNQYPYKLKSKRDVANDIVKFIITLTSNSSSSVNGVSVDRTVSKNILKS
jgi:phosphopantothenoylcysteine decarboxylase/phosphopantothenate--cysteine ligase